MDTLLCNSSKLSCSSPLGMAQDARRGTWEPMRMSSSSTLGRQLVSTSVSAPSFGFGAATRDTFARVFLSAEHAAATCVSHSPGPAGGGVTLPTGVGKQPLAKHESAPSYAFARALRFPGSGGGGGAASLPGPGRYEVDGGIGRQHSSLFRSVPNFSMGKAKRDVYAKLWDSSGAATVQHGRHSPGPCLYTAPPSIGKQGVSTRATAPAFRFGGSARFGYAHVARASTQPGPGAYDMPSTIGRRIDSRRASEPRPCLGKAGRAAQTHVANSRLDAKRSGGGIVSPGPQAYATPTGSVGKQPESTRQSAARWGFGTASRWGPMLRAEDGVPGPGRYAV
ncbi:hypothetical protein KFE25_007112 [Diacronema lutheri]|uniref:Flagellar associated protein n=2 Tax=Diacronema lutheri TaxID=2081491 RepID=A0A8J5XU93_DIALT|nr:hypothetical protein KFE25_007112 [Diacronema lutheri]